jgi:polysaccharide export outer membrane protein
MATATGCRAIDFYTPSLQEAVPPELEIPRELSMVSLPSYQIEPPDVLNIIVSSLVPRPSYRIGPSDVLHINVTGTLNERPIRGRYIVETDGTMDLGVPYGIIRVEGLTIEEAEAETLRSLQFILKAPRVSISLVESATAERLSGGYRVAPDGLVNLGRCGMVYVTGKTVTEAKLAVEERLTENFDSPQVSVEVVKYNSKSYYVISDQMMAKESMWRFPITGNETVLDAISRVQMISHISSKTIWVARPSPEGSGHEQILPVDWDAMAHGGATDTNYQIMPGDRIYMVDDKLVAMNRVLGRVADPINRVLNIMNLGATTTKGTQTLGREYNRHRRNRGGSY